MESLENADSYLNSRNKYAVALKELKLGLIKAYQDGVINPKHSESKAFMMLAGEYAEYERHLMDLITYENEYKGFEKILEAREGARSFNQSLIKNQPK